MSHPGYFPDCHVDIHAVWLFLRMSSERSGGGGRVRSDTPTK